MQQQAQRVIATVTGDDLLRRLDVLAVSVGEIKTSVATWPSEILNIKTHIAEHDKTAIERDRRITKLEEWKAKVTGALIVMNVLFVGAGTALVGVWLRVR